MSKRPKFYFFDNGVTRAVQGLHRVSPTNIEHGRLFEQFIVQEIRRINDYFKKELRLSFWRTSGGAEVDILIERGEKILLAIECKGSEHVGSRDFSGLRSFSREHPGVPVCLCAPVDRDRTDRNEAPIVSPGSLFERVRDL